MVNKYILRLENYTIEDFKKEQAKLEEIVQANEYGETNLVDYDRSLLILDDDQKELDNKTNNSLNRNSNYDLGNRNSININNGNNVNNLAILEKVNKQNDSNLNNDNCNYLGIMYNQSSLWQSDGNPNDINNNQNLNSDNRHYLGDNVSYQPLPREFKSLDKWPKRSNLECLNCGCTIDGPPIFIPRSVTNKKKKSKGKYIDVTTKSVYGVFHHFSCAAKYIKNMELTTDGRHDTTEMLKDLHYDFTGRRIKYIAVAEDKALRSSYGGHLNTKEWKQLIEKNYQTNSIFIT